MQIEEMNQLKNFIYISILLTCTFVSSANAQRLSDYNTMGWFAAFNMFHLNKRLSVLLEYQWRREHIVSDWQQSLLRTGIQFQFKNGVSTMVGYGYILTYPYGDFPAGPYQIPEHRIFEQFSWNDAIGRVALNHRIRIEQRYMGKIDQKASEREVSEWNYLNRVRYQLRAAIPLNKKRLEDKTLYTAAYDEIMISFGKNVNQNIFDQNRIGILLGYQFSKHFRAEAGFFNQTVQQGSEIGNREVFQYNNGLIINFYTNLFN